MPEPKLRLKTLGQHTLSADGNELALPGRAIALLAVLSQRSLRSCTRDYAIQLLWPTVNEERGRHSLNQMLHVLKANAPLVLVTAEGDYLLLQQEIDSDIARLRKALSTNNMNKALQLYSGAFLEHVTIEGSDFEDWRSVQQRGIVEEFERAISRTLELHFFKGDITRCIRLLESASSRLGDYWDESFLSPQIRRALHRTSLKNRDSVPMVGRETEVGLLCRAHDRLLSRHGSVVMLSGDSGFGKTMLASAFIKAAQELGSSAIMIRGYQPEQTAGFTALRELLTDDRIRAHLGELPESQQAFLKFATGESTTNLAMDSDHRHYIFDATARLLEGALKAKPTIICFDDLHWLDNSSIDLITFLARRAARLPLLLIVSLRPDTPGLIREIERGSYGPILNLQPLTFSDVRNSLYELAGKDSAAASRTLIKRTGGHPYIVGEVVKAIYAKGQWSRSSIERASTSSLQMFLTQQTAGLSPESRVMLQLLATLAKPTNHHLVRKTLRYSVASFLQAMQELMDRRLVVNKKSRLSCGHDLIRESVYSSMSPVQRVILHKRCADILAAKGPTGDVLYHLRSARDRQGTYISAIREIKRTSTMAAASESDYCYRIAIAASNSSRKKAVLSFWRAHNALALGQLKTAKRVFSQLSLACPTFLTRKLPEINLCLVDIERELGLGNPSQLSVDSVRAIGDAAELGDVKTQVAGLILRGRLHLLDGYADEEEVSAVIDQLVSIARKHPQLEDSFLGLTWAVGAFVFVGKANEAENLVAKLIERPQNIHTPSLAANLHACQAILDAHQARIRAAITHSRLAIAEADTAGLWRLRKNVLANFAGVLIEAGEDAEAMNVLMELVRTNDVDQALPYRALAHINLALLALHKADFDTSRAHARRGLQISERVKKPWGVAYASALLGLLALEQGSLNDARTHRDRVVSMAGKYFGDDELPMAKLVTQLAELENNRDWAVLWLQHLIADTRVSAVCRASLELELARLQARHNREKSIEKVSNVSAFARASGAVRLCEAAESALTRLKRGQ